MLKVIDDAFVFVNITPETAKKYYKQLEKLIEYYYRYYLHKRWLAIHDYKLLTGAIITETPQPWIYPEPKVNDRIYPIYDNLYMVVKN
jgi:hypothetical protein